RRNYLSYQRGLANIPGLTLLPYDASEKSNYQYIVAEIDQDTTGIQRDLLMDILWAENVLARRYFYPGCHRMEPYRSYFPNAGLLLARTEEVCERVLVLPTGTAVSPSSVQKICSIMRTVLACPEECRKLLAAK